MKKRKPDALIQHVFDWADYAERIIKYSIFIGFLILGFYTFKTIVSFLNQFTQLQKEAIILKQKEIEFQNLPSGTASSGYNVVTKDDLEQLLKERDEYLLEKIREDREEVIREISTTEIVDTTTGSGDAIKVEDGWVNYRDRYSPEEIERHPLWIKFSPIEGFDFDIHHNIGLTAIRTERRDDQTLRSYVKAVDNYTGKTLAVKTFETQVEELGFTRNLDLPEWSVYSGVELSSRSNLSAVLGTRYGKHSGYVRKEMFSLGGEPVDGEYAVGYLYHFDISQWFRKWRSFQ